MAKGLRIIAKKGGFRRGGIAHTTEPKEYLLDDFTKEQLQQIQEEGKPTGMLVVQEIDIKPAKDAGK
jgi:hypothetical protein